jgi:acetyl-CoA carboxylase carboxyltransferase component
MSTEPTAPYSLDNPLAPSADPAPGGSADTAAGPYERALVEGKELIERPYRGGGPDRVRVQHSKNRMTVWERIACLTRSDPSLLWHNWGPSLDGASIVTGILEIDGRDIAVYGHDSRSAPARWTPPTATSSPASSTWPPSAASR